MENNRQSRADAVGDDDDETDPKDVKKKSTKSANKNGLNFAPPEIRPLKAGD